MPDVKSPPDASPDRTAVVRFKKDLDRFGGQMAAPLSEVLQSQLTHSHQPGDIDLTPQRYELPKDVNLKGTHPIHKK